MDSKRPPNCICPAAQCTCKKKPKASLGSDIYYDTVEDPTNLNEVSSSLVLKEVADTAENLVTAFEWKMKQTIEKFRQAVASMKDRRSASQTPLPSIKGKADYFPGKDYFARDSDTGTPIMRVDNRLKICVEPVVVNVPLTLYIQSSQVEEVPEPNPEDVSSKRTRFESCDADNNESEFNETAFRDRVRKNSLSPGEIYDGSRIIRFSTVLAQDGRHLLWESELKNKAPDDELLDKISSAGSVVMLGERDLPKPQQKDLDLCVHCNCEQCPVYDMNEQVVCPKNCNCCICPWQAMPTDNPLSYHKMRTCNCNKIHSMRIPGEPAPSPTTRPCQCLPDLDICPCRDIAESRHIELYGTEMFSTKKIKKP